MIVTPDIVTPVDVERARATVATKKAPAALPGIRFGVFEEGLAAQILHLGPYAAEGPTIQRLHEFIRSRGVSPRGKHHEIYLSDPNRTAPARIRTILRQPVA